MANGLALSLVVLTGINLLVLAFHCFAYVVRANNPVEIAALSEGKSFITRLTLFTLVCIILYSWRYGG